MIPTTVYKIHECWYFLADLSHPQIQITIKMELTISRFTLQLVYSTARVIYTNQPL